MFWSYVIGQELLKKQLDYLLSASQVPHALLFTGVSGYGSLPLSIAFSLQLLKRKTAESSAVPLGEISQHPDLHFVYPVVKRGTEKQVYSHDYAKEWIAFLNNSAYGDFAKWYDTIQVGNKQGIIGVAEIEKLHQKMYLKAFSGKQKVCILWGVDKMNIQASNAFLKLLEEPPQDTYFILIAEAVEGLLPTLVSRCQHISLGPIKAEALEKVIPPENQNAKQIGTLADGDYNRLQQLLQDNLNAQHELLLVDALRKAFKARGNKTIVEGLMDWSREVAALGREEQKAFLSFSIQFFRDAFLLNYKLDKIVHFQSNTDFELTKLAPFVNNDNILDLIALFENTHYHILRNGNAKMLFSNLVLKLTRLINLPRS